MNFDDYRTACLEACRERQAVPLAARQQRVSQRHRGAREVMLNANAWQAGRVLPSDYPIASVPADLPMPLGWTATGQHVGVTTQLAWLRKNRARMRVWTYEELTPEQMAAPR